LKTRILALDMPIGANFSARTMANQLQRRYQGIKVVFMSGHTDEALADRGKIDELADLLQKPFTPDMLRRKVSEVLMLADGQLPPA
jgi:FixJ family two-component response regulator